MGRGRVIVPSVFGRVPQLASAGMTAEDWSARALLRQLDLSTGGPPHTSNFAWRESGDADEPPRPGLEYLVSVGG